MANVRIRGNEIGPTGRTVAFNLRRLRAEAGLDLRGLSKRLAELDRAISPSALSKVENLERRVDVDDLLALSIVLGVNPDALLLPPTIVVGHYVTITGDARVDASEVWAWARGERPLERSLRPTTTDASTIRERVSERAAAWAAEAEKFRARVSPGAPTDAGPGVEYFREIPGTDGSPTELEWEQLPTRFQRD